MKTNEAVDELVRTAYRLMGGKGNAAPRVLRPKRLPANNTNSTNKRMNIYIAGQIAGLDETEARGLFAEAAISIRYLGHEPLNPMALVDQDPGRSYNEYLADALHIMLTKADGVYILANWQSSKGATIERYIAGMLSLPTYYAASELPGTEVV